MTQREVHNLFNTEEQEGNERWRTTFQNELHTAADSVDGILEIAGSLSKMSLSELVETLFRLKLAVVELDSGEKEILFFPERVKEHPLNSIGKFEELSLYRLGEKTLAGFEQSDRSFLLFDWNGLSDAQKATLLKEASQLPTWEREERPIIPLIEGVVLDKERFLPSAIGFMSPEGYQAILGEDFILKESLQRLKIPPFREGFTVAFDPHNRDYFIVKSRRVQQGTLTIGFSISEMASKLASFSERYLLLQFSDGTDLVYNPKGEPLALSTSLLASQQGKPMAIGDFPFTITFYFLKERALFAPFFVLNQSLLERKGWEILGVTLLFMGLAALLLWLISRKLTEPFTTFTTALEKIAEGKYDEVPLQELNRRKDELHPLAQALSTLIVGLKDRENVRAVLNKVVSKEIAEEILKSKIQLGGEDRIVTILFADIREFTRITMNLPPQRVVSLLNELMTKISRIIEGEGGVIDKYVGDEVMALFGAPTSHPDNALQAMSAAALILETIRHWNEKRKMEGETPLEIGIGIHTGLVVAGNMGSEDRLNYTVIGASVNLAARLCQAARPSQILISEFTLEEPKVKESFRVEKLEPITVKGFAQPVQVFEVIGFKWEVE